MACTNCDNGCAEIVSDKCVKYTGVSIPSLGISNGDTLCSVEQALADFLITALNGTGIYPAIDQQILCDLVSYNLPVNPNIVDVVSALIKSVCDLQGQMTDVVEDVAAINATYTLGCLPPETDAEDAHAVLQAVITKLCSLDTVISDLLLALPLTYVALADLDALIQQYLDTIVQSSKMRNKMVPWAAQLFFGTLTGKFDATGAGLVDTDWEDIYICNGNNGTPDMRGRVPVGVIDNMIGLDTEVSPLVSASNPNYAPWDTEGANTVTLDASTLPTHTHTAAGSSITDNGHSHYEFNPVGVHVDVNANSYACSVDSWDGNYSYRVSASNSSPTVGKSSTDTTGVTVNVVNDNTGQGLPHANIQPVMACYYIMYIPHP